LLLGQLLRDTALDLLVTKGKSVEHCCILWNAFYNLQTGFDTWARARVLLELEFSETDENGHVQNKGNKMFQNINLDEMCLSLDSRNNSQGGHGTSIFHELNSLAK
jgi:hypothetical protein